MPTTTIASTLPIDKRFDTAHLDITTLPVRTDIDTEKRNAEDFKPETDQDIFDLLLSELAEEENPTYELPAGVKYPHELINGIFSPFYAYREAGGQGFVDEDYLLKHIHSESGLDYSGLTWKPQEIPAYTTTKRCSFDIETEGRDWNIHAITAIGVKLQGDYSSVLPKYLKRVAIAEVGLIWTYSTDEHEEKKIGSKMETMPEGDVYGVIYCKDEADMLQKSQEFIDGIKPDIISMHNGYEFDCRFMVERCAICNVHSYMTTIFTVDRFGDTRKKVNSAASMNGKPLEFWPTYWAKPDRNDKIYNNGQFPQILDTMHLAAMRDKLSGDMNGYGLKYLALEYIGKRKKKRTELTYKQMMKAWHGGNEADLLEYRQYLIYDVQDQATVTDFFAQGIWYQQMFMPLALQEISVASPARKWNAIIQTFYKPLEGKWCERNTLQDGVEQMTAIVIKRPQADEKVKYEGAISRVSPGIYRWFFKVDVASLYPSIMLRYKLADPKKDPLGIGLFILAQARDLRYYYKRLGNECAERGDEAGKMLYKSIDEALKVLLNGCFTADTDVLTDKGVYPIGSLKDQTVNVLNRNGDWVPAHFTSHGEQRIWEVSLKRNKERKVVRTTDLHRWYAHDKHNYQWLLKNNRLDEAFNNVVHTEDLQPGMVIRNNTPDKPKENSDYVWKVESVKLTTDVEEVFCCEEPITQGFTLGDGIETGNCYGFMGCGGYPYNSMASGAIVTAYGRILLRMMMHEGAKYTRITECLTGDTLITTRKGIFAIVDILNQPVEVIDGNGNWSKVTFTKRSDADAIYRVDLKRGRERMTVRCNGAHRWYAARYTSVVTDREFKDWHTVDMIGKRFTIPSVPTPKPYDNNTENRANTPWTVVNVSSTNEVEPTYCCVEPNTHQFVLTNNVITKNCDTDGLYCEQLRHSGPANAECVKLTESLIEKAIAKIAKLETEVATGKAEQKDLDNAKDSLKYHQERLAEMLDESLGERVIYTPEFVHHRMQSVLPNGIKLELEENEPDGVLVAPKAKNYIKFPGPDKKAKVKGLYRKRNRTVLQKDYIIEALRHRGFGGKEPMQDYVNGVINAVRTLGNQIAVENGEASEPIPLLASTHSITLELKDIVQTQRIPINAKWLVECNMGEAGGDEKVSFYWGHQKRFGKVLKNGTRRPVKGKEFPINVDVSDDWVYTVNRQYLTPENDPDNVSYRLDPVRYEGNYLKSIAAVTNMIVAGEARTSNMIEAPDMYLPEWYLREIGDLPEPDDDDDYSDF